MTDMDNQNQGAGANQQEGENHSSVDTNAEVLQSLEKLGTRLDQIEGQQRALQGDKDKGVHGLQKEVQEMRGEFSNILEYGKRYSDPVEAERNYRIDQFLQTSGNQGANVQDDNALRSGQAPTGEAPATVDPKVLQQYGIDPQGTEYLEQVKAGKTGLEIPLAIVAARQTGQLKEGAASGVSGGVGGNTGNVETQKAVLQSEYNAELDALQKASGGTLTPQQLYGVQEKYQEKGLDFW